MSGKWKRRGLLAAISGARFSRRIIEHDPADASRVAASGDHPKLASFDGEILIIGWGTIAQGLIALLLRHLTIDLSRIKVVSGDEDGRALAETIGLRFAVDRFNGQNIDEVFLSHARPGMLVISLAVDVSSVELIRLCQQHGCLYVDTSVEPWARNYNTPNVEHRTNYYFRQKLLDIRPMAPPGAWTAVAGHGANPGLVSHFAKQAVWTAAGREGDAENLAREDWVAMARDAGVRMLQLSERDSQHGPLPNTDDLFNTWSIEAYLGEAMQRAEIAVGSHEPEPPQGATGYGFGPGGAAFLPRAGAWTASRGWEPHGGAFTGMVFPH
ncbi:MAG: saccharopine dehydrogenase NADP-binding domain-containing protein, partial [Bauldia litoralis]